MNGTDDRSRDIKRFSERLRAWREADGLTQQQLAEAAGLSLASIVGYEAAKRLPERDALLRLARAFGRSMDDFFADVPAEVDPLKRLESIRFKLEGPASPELEERMRDVLRQYTAEKAAEIARQKKEGERPRPPPPKKRKGRIE